MTKHLYLIGLLPLAVVVACSSSSTEPTAVDPRAPTPKEWDREIARPDDGAAESKRTSCGFARGAMPAETLGKSVPVGGDIPIDTVVILMQENRSFDHYFAHLGKFAKRDDIDGAPDTAVEVDKAGATHAFHRAEHMCFLDTNHEWSGTHAQINGGKMDGFFDTNQGHSELLPDMPMELQNGERALSYYDEKELPFYYGLASTFGIGDRYFCSVPGPTWPNRMYLYAATSFGCTSNTLPDTSAFPYPDSEGMIFDELEKRHVDWNIYGDGARGAAVVAGTRIVNRWERPVTFSIADFYAQAAAGKLPSVAFVDPKLFSSGAGQDDEHPPGNVQVGQKFVHDVVAAMMKSPQWKRSALFITYDEHGGIYDHVAPPKGCAPDGVAPKFEPGEETTEGGFDQLGVRVPIIVVSPFAKKSFVSHVQHDHTSITRFLETRFKLPALTARDANADPMLEFFDFQNPPFLTPPALPDAVVDQAELDYCVKTFTR
ncbi:MAG: Acid phosphatase [Myxococcaceae bacterium]|nr:Acid phosphatase [Myxococcaceae bacterium]